MSLLLAGWDRLGYMPACDHACSFPMSETALLTMHSDTDEVHPYCVSETTRSDRLWTHHKQDHHVQFLRS